jgi:hypothetical protein
MNEINKQYRTNVKREQDFLLEMYVSVYLNCGNSVQETLLNNVNILKDNIQEWELDQLFLNLQFDLVRAMSRCKGETNKI